MRAPVTVILLSLLLTEPGSALEYAGTCRGAAETITSIEGLDTTRARATAQMSLPDAISYCHYSLGRGSGAKTPGPAALSACAEKTLRDAKAAGPSSVEANCRAGTLSTSGGRWSNAYKLPLTPMCGDDNLQAISLFKVLCPSYDGKIEADQ